MTLPKTSDDVKPYAQPALTVGSSEIIPQPVEIPKDVRALLGHRGQRVKLLSVLLVVSAGLYLCPSQKCAKISAKFALSEDS